MKLRDAPSMHGNGDRMHVILNGVKRKWIVRGSGLF